MSYGDIIRHALTEKMEKVNLDWRLQHESEILLYGSVEGVLNDYANLKDNVLRIMIWDDILDIVKQDIL